MTDGDGSTLARAQRATRRMRRALTGFASRVTAGLGTPRRPTFAILVLLTFALAAAPHCRAAGTVHLDLDVALDPAARTLAVKGTLAIPRDETMGVHLTSLSEARAFEVDSGSVVPMRRGQGAAGMLSWQLRAPADVPAKLSFQYLVRLRRLDPALDHRQVLGLSEPMAGPEGSFLPAASAWYPQPESSKVTYRIRVSVEGEQRAVLPGELVEERITSRGTQAVFESREAIPAIDLMAGPYVVNERMLELVPGRMVRIRTYFHPELKAYAESYLDSAVGYLSRYDAKLGAYAYPSYSIVSAPLPTGFGMPGIAYLGRRVIRLPFIRATSLGHEVLHDWFGNGIYPDYARGNWSEGLTTFLADYAFKEDEGAKAARSMRLAWLRDYAAIPSDKDRALSSFVSRRHGADQVVGYNKTAFVFFMLRDLIGQKDFDATLRGFWKRYRGRVASWVDLQREFETVAQRDLTGFFRQWVDRPGAPALRITAARRRVSAAGEALSVTVRQAAPAYRLRVPLRVFLEGGEAMDTWVTLEGEEGRTDVVLAARARSVAIDPDFRLFRRLQRDEIAPILREVMLDPRTRVVTSGDGKLRQAAMTVAGATLENGAPPLSADASDPQVPLMILGLHGEIGAMLTQLGLPPVPDSLKSSGRAYAYASRTESGRNFAVVSAPDVNSLAAVARPLPHLGAQSYAVFEGARSVSRGVWPRTTPRTAVEDQ